jgi:cytochrome c
MSIIRVVTVVTFACVFAFAGRSWGAGDPRHGAADFQACKPCHSAEPDRNMTGPSLANIWNRKAGSLVSFERYSPALKSATVVWDASALDKWLQNPAALVPGNRMTFPGIRDPRVRADLIAYLKALSSGAAPRAIETQQGGMQGMMGGVDRPPPNLRNVPSAEAVAAIAYCRDTYHVTTADGKTHDFWERNLRLKTDSSELGPKQAVPALIPAGMMGDRGDVVFASPAEISTFIKPQC